MSPQKTNRLMLIVINIFFFILFAIAYLIYDFYKHSSEFINKQEKIIENIQKIVYYDEVLTMSANMAVLTGEVQWIERYNSFVPKLDTSINESIKLVPNIRKVLDEVSDANNILISLEEQSLQLVQEQKKEQALELLQSQKYSENKELYSQSIQKAIALMEGVHTIINDTMQRKFIAVMISIFLLIVLGSLIFYYMLQYFKNFNIKLQERVVQKTQDLHSALHAAQEANQVKSQFLSNMSHEIRTPLNGILGLTDLTLKTDLTSQQKEYLEKSKNASHSLKQIINDILDFSKMEAGKLTIEMNPFELNKLMEGIQSTFEHEAIKKGVLLNFNFEKELYLKGDALRITQVLTNLISNAIKFTKEGSIDINVSSVQKPNNLLELTFTVSDTGIGMNEEELQNLFIEFSQADTSTTRNFGGTGLGLAISQNLVRLMGSKIEVTSEKNEGSTFFFTLTLEQLTQPEKISKTTQEDIDTSILQEKSVLIVEDNKTNQLVIMGLLEDFGLNLDLANNGQEAVDKFSAGKYDLILMDLQMPVMGGIDATLIIRKSDKEIPIIALTAAMMQEEIQKTKEAGMDAHLGKPIDNVELINVMCSLLEKK